MLKKIFVLNAVIAALLPLGAQAALTFEDTAGEVSLGGKITIPAFRMQWTWGTNNLPNLDAKANGLSVDKKRLEMTVNTPTTLLTGYMPLALSSGAGSTNYPAVSWGSDVTTTVVGQARFLRSVKAPLKASDDTVIGEAELVMSGAVEALGLSLAFNASAIPDAMRGFHAVGLLAADAIPLSLCGQMAGSAAGFVDAQDALPTVAGFQETVALSKKLMAAAGGFTGTDMPADRTALNTHLTNRYQALNQLAGTTTVKPIDTGLTEFAVNTQARLFAPLMVAAPDSAMEFRCGLGFVGTPGEKLVLNFNDAVDPTQTLAWKINLTPTVTYQ